jgi:serine protease AprX
MINQSNRPARTTLPLLAALVIAAGTSCPVAADASGGPGPDRFWVYLDDKGLHTATAERSAIESLSATYDAHALERRRLRRTAPGLFDARDLPVAPAYLDAIASTGARIHIASRWLNAVSVEATEVQLDVIRAMDSVSKVEPVRRGKRLVSLPALEEAIAPSVGGARSIDHGAATPQLDQIHLTSLHDSGMTGAGVRIGVLDTGFTRTHNYFNTPGHTVAIVAEHDFINNDGNAGIDPGDDGSQHQHGTYILGCIGAYAPGNLVGGAFDASFVLCKTEDILGEYPAEEDNYVAGLEFAEFHGADVVTSSLGYIDWYAQSDLDGQTAVTTIGVNIATENGVHCVTAAGNAGNDANPSTSTLIAPADALRVITCGANDGAGVIADFSSTGPTADGRVKPEVLAWGVSTATVTAFSDGSVTYVSGTSLSTPLVASAVACIAGAHPDWSVDKLRAYLFIAASDFAASAQTDPLFVRGYGILNAAQTASNDCNDNGIADETDLAGGTLKDCNANDIPDACEITLGLVPDLDNNGIPDTCTCAADYNGDGDDDILDFLDFIDDFGSCEGQPAPCGSTADADMNGDTTVDILDFLDFFDAFGAGCD